MYEPWIASMKQQDRKISEIISAEGSRLRNFIRRRVADPEDAEDILQEVFYKFVEANRLLMPIDHVTGWLFRVARNRITDLFRKKKPDAFSDADLRMKTARCFALKIFSRHLMPAGSALCPQSASRGTGTCARRAARRAA
jgi:RNA polymerase sigma factor (sigma-70 family)